MQQRLPASQRLARLGPLVLSEIIMLDRITVHKHRATVISFGFGIDLSQDTLTSQIRDSKNSTGNDLGFWDIQPLTDGTDGRYVFTFSPEKATLVTVDKGYMDVKRVSGGQPLTLMNRILTVEFKDVITT